MSFHIDQLCEKYKGKYVRIYLNKSTFVDGLLVGKWKETFILLETEQRVVHIRYVLMSESQFIIPIKSYSFDTRETLCKQLYSNVN